MLVGATHPKLVIVGASLRPSSGAPADETFDQLTRGLWKIVLPADFSRSDAGAAGQQLLEQVRAIVVTS